MIKVRVVRGIQTGLPIASGLLALSTSGLVTACSVEPADEVVDSDESALSVANPGTGVFELGWAYGTPTGYSFNARNSTDEYVRAQEKMSFTIPAYFLWSQLHPSEGTPQDVTRLQKLSAKITVAYLKQGAPYTQSTVKTTAWQGTQVYDLSATTATFTVNRKAEAMRFSLEITDNGTSPPTKKTLDAGSFFDVPVIGGSLPNKTLVFDNDGQALRSRVLEGGNAIRGADLTLAYTDWRAATLVDASVIDRQIGTATSYGRFGSFEMPIYGDIEYEVSYGVAIDNAWQDEKALTANAKSRLLPMSSNRTAYEGTLSIPSSGKSFQIYFHVKAFLKVDYSKFASSSIRWRKYNDGERILVREKWDNENGAPNDNWDFTTSAK